MKTSIAFLSLLGLVTSVQAGEWTPLIDEKLTGWEVWTGVPHTSVEVDWSGKADKPGEGKPMGLGDPLKIYSTEKQEDGTFHLKIKGICYAGLTTKKSYSNYRFRAEVKWGEKKYEPRLTRPRDSGILYHCQGEHGDFWKVWKKSLEYQVQENDNGDYFKIGDVKVEIPVDKPDEKRAKFTPTGTWSEIYKGGKYSAQRGENVEITGAWNMVEVVVFGDRAVHISNGKVVNVIRNAQHKVGGKWVPLKDGQIQIQSEGADVTYRKVEIMKITEMPKEYQAFFEKK